VQKLGWQRSLGHQSTKIRNQKVATHVLPSKFCIDPSTSSQKILFQLLGNTTIVLRYNLLTTITSLNQH